MDNQYYQPGGGYPPQQGMQPPYPPQGMGYPQSGAPQQGHPNAAPGDYAAQVQQAGYQAYTQGMQPVQPMQDTPPQSGYQSPYGGYAQPVNGQQPYAEAGYQHYFDHNQSVMQPETPPMGFPPQQLKEQKPKFRITPFHIAVMVAVLGFLGWYLYVTFVPEAAKYGQITAGALAANHAGDCLIVRSEVPYDAEGVTSVVYDAEEGSSVVRGDNICKVYSSGYSSSQLDTLQQYREEIRNYQMNLMTSETTYDAKLTRANADVLTLAKEVRDLIGGARGSLANQEKLLDAAVDARQQYLKSKYASDQRFSRLFDDELSQSQRIDSWTKQYTATTSAVISFYSDGYEYGLTSSNYTTFEPSEVRAMINGSVPQKSTTQKAKTTIYRMVEDGEWYVLFLSNDTDWNPVNGQIYELQLERFDSTQVYAEVVNFTRSGGELLVRLKVSSDVKPVLYMRVCEAVLGESLSTLCVPERAIHVQDGMTGVVVVEDSTESFIPVNVYHYEGGNAYFQAIQPGLLFEGMTVLLF